MNGLEQILLKIEEDGKNAVASITAECNQEAEKYVADAIALANEEADVIVKNAEKKASQLVETAKSGCEAYIKRQELSAKADVVCKCIEYSVEQIKNLSDKEYFDTIFDLIVKYAHGDDGELLMNAKDIARMPKGFVKKVNSELKSEGGAIELCKIPIDTDGGFIIRYGGIEENCTFDALAEDKKDIIKDKLSAMFDA